MKKKEAILQNLDGTNGRIWLVARKKMFPSPGVVDARSKQPRPAHPRVGRGPGRSRGPGPAARGGGNAGRSSAAPAARGPGGYGRLRQVSRAVHYQMEHVNILFLNSHAEAKRGR